MYIYKTYMHMYFCFCFLSVKVLVKFPVFIDCQVVPFSKCLSLLSIYLVAMVFFFKRHSIDAQMHSTIIIVISC